MPICHGEACPLHDWVFRQPLLHDWASDVVIVFPGLLASVVGRIYIHAINSSRIKRQQRFERMEVVAVDDEVAVRSALPTDFSGSERVGDMEPSDDGYRRTPFL
jgi:hypothetical protein